MDKNITTPSVSVVMPVYNSESYIAEAIQSILDQTYTDFELLIIDDCSTDQSCAIVENYDDVRIKLIRKNSHSGLINSLNLGFGMAKGIYIARMDSDDISHETRFEKQVRFLNENKNIALCGTWFRFLHAPEVLKQPLDNDDIKIALLDYCCFAHPTVMIRNSFIQDNKLKFDSAFTSCEDYEMWTRIIRMGELANIPEPLLGYRLHANQVTAKDQYNQVKNSNLCRIRMMCYPLQEATAADKEICASIIQSEPAKNVSTLKKLLRWLDHLAVANNQSLFYPQARFNVYVSAKKQGIVRRFYLHEITYSPRVLVEFALSRKYFKDCFSPVEHLKLALKCLLFWNGNKNQLIQ